MDTDTAGHDNEEFRVTVLLKEYDTLRAEILARIRSRFELLTVAVAGLAILLGRKHTPALLMLGLCGGLCGVVLALHTYFGSSIAKINTRLAAIERDVNRRLDDKLLAWESSMSKNWLNKFHEPRDRRVDTEQ